MTKKLMEGQGTINKYVLQNWFRGDICFEDKNLRDEKEKGNKSVSYLDYQSNNRDNSTIEKRQPYVRREEW